VMTDVLVPARLVRPSRKLRLSAAGGVALVTFFVYLASPVVQSADGRLVLYETVSLIEDRTLDLNRWGPFIKDSGFPVVQEGTRVRSRYPYGTALLATPIVAMVVVGSKAFLGYDLVDSMRTSTPRRLEKSVASVIVALAIGLMVLLAFEMLGRLVTAIVAGLIFAFGTSAWSTASRAMWQHGPLMLTATAGLLCLVYARRRHRWAAIASVPFAFGYLIRPTAVIPLVLVTVLVAVRYRRQLPFFLAGVAVVIVPSLVYNLSIYGSLDVPYYGAGSSLLSGGLQPTFGEALAGNLFSPARGLLIFSPVLALGALGFWWSRRDGIALIAGATVVVHWLAISNTAIWYAGYSYGPRFFADVLPYLMYLLIPVIGVICVKPAVRVWRLGLAAFFAVAASWSVFVNARGATAWDTAMWNTRPVPVEQQLDRLWDWGDPPFLRTGHAGYHDAYPNP
jgi:hypothetical protein